MRDWLILTVGTGTKGEHSNLAQGLVNTLGKANLSKFWLIPSVSPDSVAVAEMIRDNAPANCQFQPWSSAQPFRCIEQPDNLFTCRAAIREVLQAARSRLAKSERLLINPTSGTKQMSVAAVLAALDEEIGEVVFTVGVRSDGVVQTGTEELARFSTQRFFLERDLRQAERHFSTGAFQASAQVLKPYSDPEARLAREKALCLHEWHRLNYSRAASHAAQFSEELRTHLNRLTKTRPESVPALGDLLAGADDLLRWGDSDESLARFYRGAEQTAKTRLAEEHGILPPYQRADLIARLPSGHARAKDLFEASAESGVLLGNDRAWRLLLETRDPLAEQYFADTALQRGLRLRHDSLYGHGTDPVDPAQVQDIRSRLALLLQSQFAPVFAAWSDPIRLAAFTRFRS